MQTDPQTAVIAALVQLGWVGGHYAVPAGVLPASEWGWTHREEGR